MIKTISLKRKGLCIAAALMVAVMYLSGLAACSGTEALTTETTGATGGGNLSGKIDANGVLLTDVEVTSEDGVAALTLDRGTKAVDAAGRPLTSIDVVSKLALTPWYDYSIYKSTYELQPVGAVFDRPVLLTFTYNASYIPDATGEAAAVIGYFDSAASEWVAVPDVQVDTVLKHVSVKIERLGTYALAYPFPLS